MLIIILERASEVHNLGKRCTMFIRTSFADVWRIDSFCVLITYSRSSCWPKILNTFMTWHLLRVLSHKDTTPQDKQLYMYNVKFEKMTNHGSLKFWLKNKFSFSMNSIELVHWGKILYYSLFTNFLLILNYIVTLLYIFSIYNLCFYRQNLFLAFPRISCCSYSFKKNFPNSKSILSSKLLILGKNLCFNKLTCM